jgi:hypothetical protein
MLEYILLPQLISRRKHNRNALPKSYKYVFIRGGKGVYSPPMWIRSVAVLPYDEVLVQNLVTNSHQTYK